MSDDEAKISISSMKKLNYRRYFTRGVKRKIHGNYNKNK